MRLLWTPRSIGNRTVWFSALTLVVFLGLTGIALDRAFRASIAEQTAARLQAHLYSMLAVAEVNTAGELQVPQGLPQAQFNRPDSGLYAVVQGRSGRLFASASVLGSVFSFDTLLAPGDELVTIVEHPDEDLFLVAMGVSWETEQGALPLTFAVAEDERLLERQQAVFRRDLLVGFSAAGLLMLIVLGLVLRASLRPLSRLAAEIGALEAGKRRELVDPAIPELSPLVTNINALLENEREVRARHRRALADLAHSLKTPLSVLGLALDDQDVRAARSALDSAQAIVARRLKQAAARTGPLTYEAPVQVDQVCAELLAAMRRLHAGRSLNFEQTIAPAAQFFGEASDLIELLGNLVDNATRFARSTIEIRAEVRDQHANRPGLRIIVADDGPGFDPNAIDDLTKAGIRGDERGAGQGLGLAFVADLVAAHDGVLQLAQDDKLGGAQVLIELPPR